MDLTFKRGFLLAHDPNSYMERSEKRGNYRPRRRKRPPIWYAIITIIMLIVLYPVGLVLLWRKKLNWSTGVKTALSLAFAAVFAASCTYVYNLDSVKPFADNLLNQAKQTFNINDGNSQVEPGIVTSTGAPTQDAQPDDTAEPTAQPTEAATPAPTDAPTQEPTQAPTELPTEAPTDAPTQEPTQAPTPAPTFDADASIAWPGAEGSSNVSGIIADVYAMLQERPYPLQPAPTQAPTATPVPTATPSAAPTAEPTAAPTARPTSAPTQAPTAKPTSAPTQAPTARPTSAPTQAPTARPTSAPTQAPTARPTQNAQPTIRPTTTPKPTQRPTAAPTARPTAIPTVQPIVTPETVYHTQTGSRFHLTPNCGQTRGASPDTWAHSVEAGYKPCPDCVGKQYPEAVAALNNGTYSPQPTFVPDAQPTFVPNATAAPAKAEHPETVYHTQTGTKFHLTPNCGLTQGASPDTWEHSIEAGFKPCPNCVGKQYPEAVAEITGEVVQSVEQPTPTFVPDPTHEPTATPAPTAEPTVSPAPTLTPIAAQHPETVYHTQTGSRFHLTPNCGLTQGASPDTWEHSIEAGFKPCPDCVGKQYPAAVAAINGTTGELVFIPDTPVPSAQATFVPDPTHEPAATPTPAPTLEAFVYYDAEHNLYHGRADCSGMTAGVVVSEEEAIAKGAQPCAICLPNVEGDASYDEAIVYTGGGKYYHKQSVCGAMLNGQPITRAEAIARGQTECPYCHPDATPTPEVTPTATPNANDPIVYYAGGKYYHKQSVCGVMQNGQPMPRSQAIEAGALECPACHPDATPTPVVTYSPADAVTVYYSGGKYYHKQSVCGAMKNGQPMPRGQAIAAGASECPYCHPDATPTPRPTQAPTQAPTLRPTEAPTPKPTEIPTVKPTVQPTATPTSEPTVQPTETPTSAPTVQPTEIPTTEPGAEPTAIPTIVPAATSAPEAATPAPTPYYDPESVLQLPQEYVYVSSTGAHYHANDTCTYDGNAQLVRVQRAVALGMQLTACPGCQPDEVTGLPYAIVYQAENDDYFHTSETCSKLGLDSTLILLSDAVIEGKLPCPDCVHELPAAIPTLGPDGDQTGIVRWVYRTLNGQYYHSRATCSGIYSPYLVTLQDAEDAGLKPCPYCEQTDSATGEN